MVNYIFAGNFLRHHCDIRPQLRFNESKIISIKSLYSQPNYEMKYEEGEQAPFVKILVDK